MKAYIEYDGEFKKFILSPTPAKLKYACKCRLYDKKCKNRHTDIVNIRHFLSWGKNNIYSYPDIIKKEKNNKEENNFDIKDNIFNIIDEYPKEFFNKVSDFIKDYNKDPKRSCDSTIIDLIAWLINYENRPFEIYKERVIDGSINVEDGKSNFIWLLGERTNASNTYETTYTSKQERYILNNLLFYHTWLLRFNHLNLNEVLKEYGLEENPNFINCKEKLGSNLLFLILVVDELESTIAKLDNQLVQTFKIRKYTFGLGLLFLNKVQEKPSIDQILKKTIDRYATNHSIPIEKNR